MLDNNNQLENIKNCEKLFIFLLFAHHNHELQTLSSGYDYNIMLR